LGPEPWELLNDLPDIAMKYMHVDWSPSADYVASGGKDRTLKFETLEGCPSKINKFSNELSVMFHSFQ
jgi:WD40 repeat protein